MRYTTCPTPPADAINPVFPRVSPSRIICEYPLSVGLFFDGTGNSEELDRPRLAQSNVVRLSRTYPDELRKQAVRYYMPGVGTPFPEIGEHGESKMGAGFGNGGDARILYAMLQVLNAVHRFAFEDQPLFDRDQILALCRNGNLLRNHETGKPSCAHPEDAETLAVMGESHGLRGGEAVRRAFFLRYANELQNKLRVKYLPGLRPCELFLDIFGFSRGATQARVFCNWMEAILTDGKLAGVPVRLRFLGIFDSVASVGIKGVLDGMLNVTDGHGDWASVESLKVLTMVERCVHLIAMHEFRKNFPLDCISEHCTVLPPGWVEHIYPGAHCDVGGGYAPGEMGVAKAATPQQGDALKLSQIPLSHMYECAWMAGVPLKKGDAVQKDTKYDPFAIAPELQQAYDRFIQRHGTGAREVCDWAQPYLTWRWQQRDAWRDSKQFSRATDADRAKMTEANNKLIADAQALVTVHVNENASGAVRFIEMCLNATGSGRKYVADQAERAAGLDAEAAEVLAIAKTSAPLPPDLAQFFDEFVHDSYAGFTIDGVGHEPTGYWRYRKGFKGTAEATIVQTDAPPNAKVA